jgi:hypothetical protein
VTGPELARRDLGQAAPAAADLEQARAGRSAQFLEQRARTWRAAPASSSSAHGAVAVEHALE